MQKLSKNSKVTEVDSAVKKVIACYDKGDWSSDIHLTGLFTELKEKSEVLTTVITLQKGESDLDGLDDIRDEDLRSLYYLTMGNLHNPQSEVKEASRDVFDIIGSWGLALAEESYAVESSILESMFLRLEEKRAALALIPGAEELYQKLRLSQSNFRESELAFEAAKAKDSQKVSATDMKKEILPLFNGKVLLYIHAMSVVDESAYGELARTTEQIIRDNNSIVKKRTS